MIRFYAVPYLILPFYIFLINAPFRGRGRLLPIFTFYEGRLFEALRYDLYSLALSYYPLERFEIGLELQEEIHFIERSMQNSSL